MQSLCLLVVPLSMKLTSQQRAVAVIVRQRVRITSEPLNFLVAFRSSSKYNLVSTNFTLNCVCASSRTVLRQNTKLKQKARSKTNRT